MCKSDSIVISSDDDTSARPAIRQRSALAERRAEPFADPNPILEYARIRQPEAATIRFTGSKANGLEIKARLREVSPVTFAVVSPKVHDAQAHGMLPGNELVNLIEQQGIRTSTRLHFKRGSSFADREVNLGCCA